MIDLVLYGTKANLRAFAMGRGLLDSDGNTHPGVDYFWWNGDGRFMTVKPVMSADGETITTPATYLPGFVMLLRISEDGDTIKGGSGEQWSRSKVAQYIKDNGTPGTMGAIPYYEISNVRLFRAADVFSWLASQGIPSNEWFGGNSI
jgi:hypothetical protein